MTCIAGIAQDGNVWIGGDSAGVGGYSLAVRADTKVFTKPGGWIFGFTTSFRMGQLLNHKLTIPAMQSHSQPLEPFLCGLFIDAVRKCLKDGGYAKTSDGQEEGGTFLVGHRGRLFAIYDDYQVEETVDGFAAVGCGQDLALGALYASKHLPPEERIEVALEAAERHSAGVRAPFVIKTVKAFGTA